MTVAGETRSHRTEAGTAYSIGAPATGEPARERALESLEQARQALAAADRHLGDLLTVLAHELRNPLAPIGSAVQIMRRADGDHATSSAAQAIIERQVRHLVRLVDDLADVSRLVQGHLELRRERVDLGGIVRMAVEINRTLLESKQQHVLIDLGDDPLTVEADATRLTQVFANLINNAAKYSDSSAEIGVRAARETGQVVVTVTDRGLGIRADRIEGIFDLFARGSRSERFPYEGLGLGLTLVKRLVELHGGTVKAWSPGPGEGSSFSVRLELVDSESGPTAVLPANKAARGRAWRARILIADDNRDAAQSLALLLGMEGHDVRTAGDGLEALRIAEEFRPRLAILDIGMPRLDGYEAARRIRLRPWAAQTRLFALTGWGREEDRDRAREAGFDQLLIKPIDPDALSELIDRALMEA